MIKIRGKKTIIWSVLVRKPKCAVRESGNRTTREENYDPTLLFALHISIFLNENKNTDA